MDLYFRAAAIMVIGTLFIVIVGFFALNMEMATTFWQRLTRNADNFTMDVSSVQHTFIVDRAAFHQFAHSVQSIHTVLLHNGDQDNDNIVVDGLQFTEGQVGLYWFRIIHDERNALPPGVSDSSEWASRAALTVNNPAVDLLIPGAADEDMYFRTINISGQAGTHHNTVAAFLANMGHHRSIRVQRFVREDGSVILLCDWTVIP